MGNWKPTRWKRFCWRHERWAPFYVNGRGECVWMTPWSYVALLWHRLSCALGRVPAHGYPVRPAKRVLVVPIEGGPPPGASVDWASVDWRPGMMPQGRKQDG